MFFKRKKKPNLYRTVFSMVYDIACDIKKVFVYEVREDSESKLSNQIAPKMIISITDGVTVQERSVKEGVTREQAEETLKRLFEDDYLRCTYTLWVDGVEVLTLGADY